MNSDEVLKYLQTVSKSKLRCSEEIIEDLIKFGILLAKWQNVQNLVSRETLSDLWQRHFLDSLQVIELFDSKNEIIVDFGSGGGLPAIPIAIAYKQGALEYHLIESNKRKVSFLKTVGRTLDLNIKVHGLRVEEFCRDEIPPIDVITSRATAPLTRLFELAYPLVTAKTRLLFHKGADSSEELDESRANWHFDVISYSSKTSDAGVILEIQNLQKRIS